MAYPGRTLLTCWLVVVLTGTAVGHRHAAAQAHSHGLGWAVIPGTPGSESLPLDHRHLVLLGIEFGPTGVPADGDTSAGSGTAAGMLAVTEAEPPDAATAAEPLPPTPAFAPAGALAAVGRAAHARPATSCALVTHARTGVLRS
ncbi:hypothetical protein [Urbifossiella limnaea]|uniref:Uncharacterized protein n=1 Tax=Urbifossiella limnaea TaxID=2528023 RepID=A0A517Y291_9BACT|nr:hypothetical protein [Urbifossiella limnaea]QDU23890.1 hypothetical protein ETAA1_59000 [Urbifossiella limnaea]